MKKPLPKYVPIFKRADAAALAQFDPASKLCTMNCGPHKDDPRTPAERQFLCTDCLSVNSYRPTAVNAGGLTVERVVEVADQHEWIDPESGNKQLDRLGFAIAIYAIGRSDAVRDYIDRPAAEGAVRQPIKQDAECIPYSAANGHHAQIRRNQELAAVKDTDRPTAKGAGDL